MVTMVIPLAFTCNCGREVAWQSLWCRVSLVSPRKWLGSPPEFLIRGSSGARSSSRLSPYLEVGVVIEVSPW